MNAKNIARTLSAVLIFQLGIGALLVFGDMKNGSLGLPSFAPDAPRLSEPIRPGDQRRQFTPSRDRPTTRPARDAGPLPDRLTLTREDGQWRLEGQIEDGDADRLIPQLTAADPAITELILQSPGGAVRDALALGRHLRSAGITTRVLSGEICYSACPYLLAGGPTRDIAEDASIGVHQHSFDANTLLPAFIAIESIQRGQSELMAYLIEMGIDTRVMIPAMATPAEEIYILLPEELRDYKFVTEDS